MRPDQKQKFVHVFNELISQANQVVLAVGQAKLFRVNCREMGMMVCQLSQMLKTLLRYISLDPVLFYLNPIHCFSVISMVSRVLNEALSLACMCKHNTVFCQLFTATYRSRFHKLYRLLDTCIANTNRLLIIYDPGFNRFLAYGSPTPSAWSCMVTTEHCGGESHLHHGLMTLMEITTEAEYNHNLRCKAFKTNSPGGKAIVELLLKVIKESEDSTSKVLAIRSIGSLAKIFRENDNHEVISALVSQLENGHGEVVTEALVALIKFACDHNHLCRQHSNRMIELNAAQLLVKLLSEGEREWGLQFHGLQLMCFIAFKADYSAAVEQDRVVTAIRQLLTQGRTAVSRHPKLRELATKALGYFTLYYQY
ncbi:hypothetical protein F3Y22_tig00111330pilonHSYRG00165 [Hibiscus syriacus]|uniref:DUF7792 domain-containing protein n=1 Tax=Hibiscus syriacus TaxID=106335 RepID=A0A6A2YPR4_HIBSY|nr:hypothetical protein F3Y22_tig00111330pilonHSYRG00165 [Hibiscus syriacus]